MSTEALAKLRKQIIEDYRTGKLKLPSQPEIALRIRQALNNERHSANQLSRIVQLDPALAARLLQIANSARYFGSSKLSSCRDAIARLGLPATRNLATSLAMHNAFNFKQPQVKKYLDEVWRQSYHVAAIAHVLGAITPGIKQDQAMLGGLVHNIGVLPLLPYLGETPELVEDPATMDLVIGRMKGQLGTLLLRHWQFDESLVSIPQEADNWLRDHEGPADYVDIVLVSRIHSQFGGKKGGAMLQSLRDMPAFQKLPISRFGPDASIQLIEEANEEIGMLKQLLRGQ